MAAICNSTGSAISAKRKRRPHHRVLHITGNRMFNSINDDQARQRTADARRCIAIGV
jgi:hypothetical protein